MNGKLNFQLLEDLWIKLCEVLYDIFPKIVLGLLFIIISWLIIKGILFIVKKALKLSGIHRLNQKINEIAIFNSAVKIESEKVILFFVRWFLILVFIIIGSDFLGMELMSKEVSKLIDYLPRFFSGLVIFILGLYGATYLKNFIRSFLKVIDVNGSRVISQIIFVMLSLIVFIITLNHIGLNTDIVSNNLFLILGSILAAFTIAFGLGSKDIILRLLLGFYLKRNIQVGKKIMIDGKIGTIKSIDNITFVVSFEDRNIFYPIKYISNKNIEILN